MRIVKNNLIIRDFKTDDIKDKINIINDSKNNTFLHYDLPLEYDKTLKWFENKNNANRLDCTILYNNKVCGFIGLLNISSSAEYYICIDHNFAGKHIGYDASKMLLDYAFLSLNIEKVYLYTEIDNAKAQHLFEKVGFTKKNDIDNNLIYNDRVVSRYIYELCREEYEK